MSNKSSRCSTAVVLEEVTTLGLSPTQAKVKKPRRVYYDGKKKNCDPELARDIIILYTTCKLGYSPIRHLLGLPNDKKIEDVIRQHMLGRNNVDGSIGELYCPGSKYIGDIEHQIVKNIASKYRTTDDPYVKDMITHNKWSDDPVVYIPKCPKCGKVVEREWIACPFCMCSLK